MFNDKSILITGGTGSFGKRFVRRILENYRPARLIIYSRDELKQYEMAKEFSPENFPCMRYFLGDVRDYSRLARALHGVDYVIHAAALKHVTAGEYNPFEFIKTNVLGAQNIIEGSVECGVTAVVALSTDKACNPINLYGTTKLCSDKLFVAGNSYSGEDGPRFSIVRYGNVVGSRGSVVPFFMQARKTGVLPITDERMTRFWITLDAGVDLVFKAFENAQGGEIFVPKIPSMRVTDLAKSLAPECDRKIVGIRPGEKLHECMISEEDAAFTLEYDSYYTIQPSIYNAHRDPSRIGKGKPVPENFRYASDNNSSWLSPEDLLNMLKGYSMVGNELVKNDESNLTAARQGLGVLPDEIK
ncbi:MAG: UDP-N-acetylglucosamine 4,6-dehydratase (inverting) [Proteobacteria bacterium]|nr:MAG: UDP-N-acetylglucosamine 4,6-dehydratase (inverting) [Pseudomonadota bacterium]